MTPLELGQYIFAVIVALGAGAVFLAFVWWLITEMF